MSIKISVNNDSVKLTAALSVLPVPRWGLAEMKSVF